MWKNTPVFIWRLHGKTRGSLCASVCGYTHVGWDELQYKCPRASALLPHVRASVHTWVYVCEKHDSTPAQECFHLLHQPHTKLSAVSPALYQAYDLLNWSESRSQLTLIYPTSLWEEGGGGAEEEHDLEENEWDEQRDCGKVGERIGI